MKAFITGATGFLGRHLVAELLANGYAVHALARTMNGARALPANVRVVPGDVTKAENMRAGMAGSDVVFHLAAWHQVGIPASERGRMERINVGGTRNVIGLAEELGVRKIVHVSTVAAFGDTHGATVDEAFRPSGKGFRSEYERTKHLAHFDVAVPAQARGLPVIIVCPGMIYGPGDTSQFGFLLDLFARRRLPVMVGPDNSLTWAHVEDVATGLRLAAERGRPGETYMIAGPGLTLRGLFEAAERGTGLSAPRLWLSSGVARILAGALSGVRPAEAELMRNVEGVSYLATSQKARRELGWEPRPVEIGIAQTIRGIYGSTPGLETN